MREFHMLQVCTVVAVLPSLRSRGASSHALACVCGGLGPRAACLLVPPPPVLFRSCTAPVPQAYEVLELFLEMLVVRAELLAKSKEMPPDMVEVRGCGGGEFG